MNLVVGAPLWLVLLLVVALAVAAIEDAVRLRISNLTCLVVIVCAIAAVALEGFQPALWQNAAVFILVLMLGTAAFAAGVLGGGDVKLLAGLGLWVNFSGAMALVAAVFLAGGLVALLYLATRAMRRATDWKSRRVPYGIAIAIGAIFVFGLQRGHLPGQPRPLPPIKILLRHH